MCYLKYIYLILKSIHCWLLDYVKCAGPFEYEAHHVTLSGWRSLGYRDLCFTTFRESKTIISFKAHDGVLPFLQWTLLLHLSSISSVFFVSSSSDRCPTMTPCSLHLKLHCRKLLTLLNCQRAVLHAAHWRRGFKHGGWRTKSLSLSLSCVVRCDVGQRLVDLDACWTPCTVWSSRH